MKKNIKNLTYIPSFFENSVGLTKTSWLTRNTFFINPVHTKLIFSKKSEKLLTFEKVFTEILEKISYINNFFVHEYSSCFLVRFQVFIKSEKDFLLFLQVLGFIKKHFESVLFFNKPLKIYVQPKFIDHNFSNQNSTFLAFSKFFEKDSFFSAKAFSKACSSVLASSQNHIKTVEFIQSFLNLQLSLNSNLLGVGLKINGRLNGSDRTKSLKFYKGKIPLQKREASIDIGISEFTSSYGKNSLVVLFYYK